MVSFWERESLLHYDYIIAGSGITGLSTAIELRKRFPASKILVADSGIFPLGASTRNAGFACMGSLSELTDDLRHTDPATVVELFSLRKRGLEILRQRLGDDRIDYREKGSYELLRQDELWMLDEVDNINDMLWPVTNYTVFQHMASHEVSKYNFSTSLCNTMVRINGEGELHTGNMMRALLEMAIEHKIEIRSGCAIRFFEETSSGVRVQVNGQTRGDNWTLSAKHLFICTNAFTKLLLPEEDVQPGRGQVLVTRPIHGLPWKGIYHFDKGYYYFREVEGRILFGGGRHLDFDQETTTEIELNREIQSDLIHKLQHDILPGIPFEIDLQWSGIMAFGKNKFPVVKNISPHISGAFRMGGMGVALGSAVARELVTKVCRGI